MELYATLEDLPSKIFYEQLKEEGNSNIYIANCEAETKIKEDSPLVNLCAKTIKNFKLIEEFKDNYTFKDKPCNDLNYWVREELIKVHDIKVDTVYGLQRFNNLYIALNQIQKKNEVGINDNCKIDYTSVSMEELRERKNLYDYLENYGELEKKYVQNKNECSRDYFDYVTNSVALYKNFKKLCEPPNISQSKCPYFFNNIPVYYPNKDLSELTCKLENEQQEIVAERGESSIHTPDAREKGSSQEGATLDIDKTDTDVPHQPSSSLSNTLMTTGVPVLGSFFAFSILYKLTPIGSLIRNRLLGVGESVNQVHDNAADGLWEDSMEPLDINSDRSGYQLSYQTF
ncbi:PIR Superfamily Protein [Plasmodium ovale wallikeri]|uniref:PIR Superfamily Protein n=1 Tax=Plasmodium ovale wallikeri TaxID=864142 RepID=A0A1A9AH63_PLAOA|nr:PIR Superfamily Protein [Plasmodium ovale wallikeri]